MYENVIEVENVGKMYKRYKNPKDKILDAFNLAFLKKNVYEEFWVLKGMNFKVKKGERVGLIGNNGAGKSTLLKLIIGNVQPTEGNIKVKGEIQALMELGTGFHPEFTGRQNIRASLAYRGLLQKEIESLEEEIIDFSELDEFIDQPVRTYSAGMYARLAFSTATSISPDILIIDEVLGAGDAYFNGKCVERMKKITTDSGATVLFVSHDLNSILQLCDRVIWIEKGKIKEQGDPIEVVKEYTASVRKREEMRLKAREKRKYDKHDASIQKENIKLFRILTLNEDTPREKNKIYKISLVPQNVDSEKLVIDIGEPMDNSYEQDSYIVTDKEYMNWGDSNEDENGTFRFYYDRGGKYKHAPFVFTIEQLRDKYKVELCADIHEPLKVQRLENDIYEDIGIMEPAGYHIYEISVKDSNDSIESNENKEINEKNEIKTPEKTKYSYGNRKAEITNVMLLNSDGKEVKIIETETKLKVVIEYIAYEKIDTAVFVFCIYTTDGKCASQWIGKPDMYQKPVLKGKGKFIFKIDKLLLGKGSYVASVGIFNGLLMSGAESESYCVIDRSIFFEIRQPITDGVDKGICIQPFVVELQEE